MDLLDSFDLPTCSFSSDNKNSICMPTPGWCSGWRFIAVAPEEKKGITRGGKFSWETEGRKKLWYYLQITYDITMVW